MTTTQTIVLITGATQGIGLKIARQLCASHPDYLILLSACDPERGAQAAASIQQSTGHEAIEPITIDVTSDTSIAEAARHFATKYGSLDVLINNAGINNEVLGRDSGRSSLRDIYREAYDVNVFGAAMTTEAFIPLLFKSNTKSSNPPRVVFVSSHTGSLALRSDPTASSRGVWYTRLHTPTCPIYRSSKAALNMLTLHYATRFEGEGWKVNASCPNLTATGSSGGVGRPVGESARNVVRLATLGGEGETGTYSDEEMGCPEI
ncbi:hypothetical protein VTN00DRAFT_522 [Thermoascus crustaceus]|uniref:uncharacterized protein n=1 Tax=Thermoascus crustaceus TaxID=5088 RepID=UPI0037442667